MVLGCRYVTSRAGARRPEPTGRAYAVQCQLLIVLLHYNSSNSSATYIGFLRRLACAHVQTRVHSTLVSFVLHSRLSAEEIVAHYLFRS